MSEAREARLISYETIPHVGVGPVKLGMTREEVRRVMPGPYESFLKGLNPKHKTDAFHNCGFQVFYGGELPVVEYIELSRESGFRVVYRGVDVFTTPAEQLVAYISGDATFDSTDPELGYAYILPDLDITLWRPVLPESPENPTGREFSTIGVGVIGYYPTAEVDL
jgi:hypothetical protein